MAVDVTALSIKVESIGIKEASNQLGGLTTSATNAEKRVLALAEAMKKLNLVSSSVNATTGSTAALTAALNALNTTLSNLNQRTTQADTSQRRHNDAMREANGLARGLSGSLGALWLTYGAFAGMAVGLGIGATLKGIVTVGKDVEHTLEGIRVKGQETIADINEMRKAIFDLGKGVYGPQQVAEAFEVLVLAGLNAKEALNSVNAAMNLALVGGTSIEKAASTLVSVGTSVGYMAEGFDRVGDVIAKTAALSMSSVASLSEAFKSGSSVAKLYGVSLEDIGTNLGVLSNLGIQGSAAGTAMKNFYKELAAGSDKVQSTFKAMKISSMDLKDSATGDFLPILDVVKKLAEGMSNLTAAQQKIALANLTNERGMRLAVQLLGEYNTKTGESSNALKDFRKNVEDSYGFAAIAAVAMSLTAKSQIDSMVNTLKTSFAETFTEMQPEIIAFTGRMKEIFGSQSFKDGVRLLAQSFANLAVTIAENLPLITNLVLGFVALRVIIAASAMWTAAAAGITAIATALRAAAVGALTFQAALGPLALALAVVTAAIVLYNNAKEDGNKHAQMAQDYSNGYLSGLREEELRLGKVNEQLKKKLTLSEANANITRGEAREKMMELNNKAIAEAEDNLKNGIKWTGYTKPAQAKELERLKAKAAQDIREADLVERGIKMRAKANADIVKENAKLNREVPEGDGTLGGKPSKSAISDAYTAAMVKQLADVRAAKKEMQAFEEQINLRFKTGEIGKLQVIEETSKKQLEMYNKAQEARLGALAVARGKGSKGDTARIESDMEQAEDDFGEKKTKNRLDSELAVTQAVQKYTSLRIAELEKEGSYGRAAQLKWSADNDATYKQAIADAKAYGDVFPVLNDVVEQFSKTQKAAIKEGLNKEAVHDFNVAADTVQNSLKGIQTASEGQGLGAMFKAAQDASAAYLASLPALRTAMADITDPKGQQEALARMTNLAETQRKLWTGVGEAISTSLESAFGRGGKAAGDLIKIAQNYSNLEKKTDSARVKAYGDAAGAAKNFFKEGSTGYKLMETAEKAFRIVELLGMQKSLMATITNAAAKAAAYVPAVIMSFMASLGPYGAAAAAVAIGAVLGGAFGGGSNAPESSASRQKSQGTGSVFGSDEKSASIVNSLSIMEKNSGLGLVQGSQMVSSLRTMVGNISSLATMLVKANGVTGDMAMDSKGAAAKFTEGAGAALTFTKLLDSFTKGWFSKISGKISNAVFGGNITNLDTGFSLGSNSLGSVMSGGVKASQYSDSKKDGGMFRSDKYTTSMQSLGAETNDQFTKVIVGMSETLKSASDIFGIGGDSFTAKLKTFIVDIGKVSLKGLKGAELQTAIEGVFSKLGDDMAKFAFAGFEQFQQIGEGYLQTVARLANDLVQVKDVFAVLNKTFSLTGIAAITVSEGLIAAAGGLEKLTSGTKFYVDNFLTEAERMGPVTASVTKRLAELGVGELTTIELFKKKIRALDLTNAADQKLYAALIEIAPAFKEAADFAADLAEGVEKLSKAQQKALDAVNKARENLQKSYDKESGALQSTIDKTKAFITTLKSYQDSIKLGADSPLTNMQKYAEARKQFDATMQAAQGGDQGAKDKLTGAASALLSASKVINASGEGYTSDFNMVQTMLDQMIGSATSQVDVATASLNALNKQVEGLLNINNSVMSVTQAVLELKNAIILGGLAGLTNTQMETTYIPTQAEITAVSPQSSSTLAPATIGALVGTVEKMGASFDAYRVEAKEQTIAIVQAAIVSSQNNANTTVEGMSDAFAANNRKKILIETN